MVTPGQAQLRLAGMLDFFQLEAGAPAVLTEEGRYGSVKGRPLSGASPRQGFWSDLEALRTWPASALCLPAGTAGSLSGRCL